MESFYRTYFYLINHVNPHVRRKLMDEIDWNKNLIGIKGTRGVGKTTFLLSYAKENFGTSRSCLYINLNNFYFTDHTLIEFADSFCKQGGKVLLIDQIFKYPDWSRELRYCHDHYPDLKIVFTGSPVIRLKEENPYLSGIVSSYYLQGFSFREFLNLKTGNLFNSYTLNEILENHLQIANEILEQIDPTSLFQSYLHHGFYPFFLEQRNFSENLLKTVNMMLEVDILLIKQIELKYLHKIKKLIYLLAKDAPCTPNISQLSSDIQTSRATVMNYIKYLKEARVFNVLYKQNEGISKKPVKVYLHNTNLMYVLDSNKIENQAVGETFFLNAIGEERCICKGNKKSDFLIDNQYVFRLSHRKGENISNLYMSYIQENSNQEVQIPLWLFGFLY